ncbi:hypothetical protein BGX34_010320 [Mortierella sp. NVP85]|nr:hypothetical protein BGX34_010320 [Mortierella sp. NVP85]
MAEKEGWLQKSTPGSDVGHDNNNKTSPFEFKVLNTFENMRNSVNDGSSDAFLWEKFTTKPYHDSNEVRSVDTITPPWPAFMIAASTSTTRFANSTQRQATLARFLSALSSATEHFVNPDNYEESITFVQNKMSYTRRDVEDWFSGVQYPNAGCAAVDRESLATCARILLEAGVIQKDQEADVKENLDTKYVDAQLAQLV